MAKAPPKEIRIKKVPAFPFPVQIVHEKNGPMRGRVMKAGKSGLIVENKGLALKVGDRFVMTFELPVFRKTIKETGKVVKIYSHFDSELTTGQLAEIHFVTLSGPSKEIFLQFLAAVGMAV